MKSINHITTTISTKRCKMGIFWSLFQRKTTPLPEATYMVQYLLESMFIYYILQKWKGVAQNPFSFEIITGEDASHSLWCSNMIPNLTSLQIFCCLCVCVVFRGYLSFGWFFWQFILQQQQQCCKSTLNKIGIGDGIDVIFIICIINICISILFFKFVTVSLFTILLVVSKIRDYKILRFLYTLP